MRNKKEEKQIKQKPFIWNCMCAMCNINRMHDGGVGGVIGERARERARKMIGRIQEKQFRGMTANGQGFQYEFNVVKVLYSENSLEQ